MGGVIVITMGDPAGIGPEIILKGYRRFGRNYVPVVVGDAGVLDFYRQLLKIDVPLKEIKDLSEAEGGFLNVLSLSRLGAGKDFSPGVSSEVCGKWVVEYIKKAVSLCMAGGAQAVVTAPISKASMHRAGYSYPGHTELLAELTGTKTYAMMLTGGGIRVVLVTIHVPLKEVPSLLTREGIEEKIELTVKEMKRLYGIDEPEIAVCGLNPHAGEDGAFGDEEQKIISPAIKKFEGRYKVSGPHPADTVFYWQKKGKYHAVIAMYHDQGLIPVKLAGFEEGVNVTLGLPIIRTSPDHGTAFDIAGKGVADPTSIVCAYNLASLFAENALGNKA
ncbi:MAG: 4-hydroxythreonine-4-phosphate dehydrogenase PdxA [Deferribacteres bacterium]|nr:4-hydroxythreonine-4-phosphate dehydrogenase PdxA [Deferribacteres bacterium]